MSERHHSGNSQMNANGNESSVEEQITTIAKIMETLDYPELLRLRDLITQECNQKAEAAKASLIAETQRKFEQLGLSFGEVMAIQKKKQRKDKTPAVAKYRSPDGKAWSGRGPIPKWMREIEEAGGNREDFRIKEEG
jgi:DNA-binding protein H-NS